MSGIFTQSNVNYMLSGMGLTLRIAVVAGVFSLIFGTVFALLKKYCTGPFKIFSMLAAAYVELFRCTPQLLWILLFRFFVKGGGFNLGVISLTVVNVPYVCEIVRGGLNNINKGQFEAGYSQGFGFISILWNIVLPQTFRAIIPSLMSQIVSIIKGTSLLASINIFEYLACCSDVMVNATSVGDILLVYLAEAVGYFSICYLMVLIVHLATKKLKFA